MDATFKSIGKSPFSAATGVNLSLYHNGLIGGERRECSFDLFLGLGYGAFRHANPSTFEQLFRLVFVYVHENGKVSRVSGFAQRSSLFP